MTPPDEPRVVTLRPGTPAAALARACADAGWRPQPAEITPALPAPLPVLAQWTHPDGGRLTLTTDPRTGLAVLEATGADHLLAHLPIETDAELRRHLADGTDADVDRALAAIAARRATDLERAVAPFIHHPDPARAALAARVHLELLHARATALALSDDPELDRVLIGVAAAAAPLLHALVDAPPDVIAGLAPDEADCAAAFRADLAPAIAAAYAALWRTPPAITPGPDRRQLTLTACPAERFAHDDPHTRNFPGGWRHAAPYLRPGRVWIRWRYHAPGRTSGLAFDGLTRIADRWIWFPHPHRVIGRIVTR